MAKLDKMVKEKKIDFEKQLFTKSMLDLSFFLEMYAHKILEYRTRNVVSMQEIQKHFTQIYPSWNFTECRRIFR